MPPSLRLPGNPVGVAVSRDGSRVYVTSSEGKTLSVIDAAERKVVKTISLKGGPFGVAVHPSGRPVYVTDWFEHRIWVISPDSGEVTAEVAVGNSPSGIAVTGDGRAIVTADRDSDQLSFIDAANSEGQRRREGRQAAVRRDHRR